MFKDVIIEVSRGKIVFTCGACKETGTFDIKQVRAITGGNVIKPCPLCKAMIAFNRPYVSGMIRGLLSGNPALENPFSSKEAEELPKTVEVEKTPVKVVEKTPVEVADDVTNLPTSETTASTKEHIPGRDTILVVDFENTFIEDVRIVFTGIANVESHGASLGAVKFIKDGITKNAKLILMDGFLGDGTCFDVLERLKDNEQASAIPVIIVSTTKENEKMLKESVSEYPQVKFIIPKEDLMKKLIGISSILTKQKGGAG